MYGRPLLLVGQSFNYIVICYIMRNKRNRVGGVVRPGLVVRTTMVITLPTNGNNIPPIDKAAKRQKT